MNIPKIEEAITLLYQTYIEDQDVATQRGMAITAMNEMVKLLGGDDVVKNIEAVPYSARLRAQHLFEDETPQPAQKPWVGLTDEDFQPAVKKAMVYYGYKPEHSTLTSGAGFYALVRDIEAKLKEKNER